MELKKQLKLTAVVEMTGRPPHRLDQIINESKDNFFNRVNYLVSVLQEDQTEGWLVRVTYLTL